MFGKSIQVFKVFDSVTPNDQLFTMHTQDKKLHCWVDNKSVLTVVDFFPGENTETRITANEYVVSRIDDAYNIFFARVPESYITKL